MDTLTKQKISAVKFEEELLVIQFGEQICKWKISEISSRLTIASSAERSNYKISPSGYGIHWPEIDEDLSIEALLINK